MSRKKSRKNYVNIMKSESKSSQSRQRYAQQSCESCFGEVLYLATQNERLRG